MIEIFHNPNYDFIGKRKWAYIVSAIVTLIGLVSLVTQGLRYDIDFTGGTLVQVRFEKTPTVAAIRAGLNRINLGESIIQEFGDTQEFIIRLPLAAGTDSQQMAKRIEAALGQEPSLGKFEMRRVEFVGPQVGKELQWQAVYAVLFGLEKEWSRVLAELYEARGEEPTWYSGRHGFDAGSFGVAVASFSTASSTSWSGSSSSSSSSGSSGGGSSGGGGGGGGGGGV